MKILLLHTDFIEWEPKKKALKNAEKVAKKAKRVKDALVVFSAVEKADEANPQKIAEKNVKAIMDVCKKVKARKVVLYPYVHLSPHPASPAKALRVLKESEKLLKEKKISVDRAPFGWYKAFNLKCKGHPLAELSREISLGEEEQKEQDVSEAVRKEEKLKSEWYVMEPSGKRFKIELKGDKIVGYDFRKYTNLEKFARYEIAKSRVVDKEPPHIPLMKKLALVGYESGSDPGHLRYPPKGKLMKDLIEEWVTRKMIENGAVEVETPIMYDYEHPSLKKYLHRFPARQYTIHTPNKRVFLRFSACFGQFLMARDASISYRNLPLWMYELTRYSFRVEQRGELAGLRRLRAFTMPDCHAICKDITQAKEEMMKRLSLSLEVQKGLGLNPEHDFEFGLRVVKDFYNKNRDYIKALVQKWGKPVLVEMWNKRFFYFVMKYEFNFIDALGKASALTTDQIDVENGERYNLLFTDKDNKKKYPIILHLSPSGAIERVMYALLEKACMEQQDGKNPVFPLWLSPTQVRMCPVSDAYVKYAEDMATELAKENIRVDVDDRIESVQKKIRDAEMEWVPLIVVLGQKERDTGQLPVRFRETGKVEKMNKQELIDYISSRVSMYPYKPLPLPRLLSRRPVFV